jgi:hypothetical protein
MDEEPKVKEHRFPWGIVIAITFVIIAGLYASQHPHSFLGTLLRVILSP